MILCDTCVGRFSLFIFFLSLSYISSVAFILVLQKQYHSIINALFLNMMYIVKMLPFRVATLQSRFNGCLGYFPVSYKKSFPTGLIFLSALVQLS